MSWEHVEAIYKCEKVGGTANAILAYLGHRANEDHQCWPSRETISAETGVALNTVSRWLKSLASDGLITINRKQYHQIYTLQMFQICTPETLQMFHFDDSDVPNGHSDVPITNPDVPNGHSDVPDLTPNSKVTSHLNSQENGQGKKMPLRELSPPDEDYGIGLRYNRGVVQQVFGPATPKVWPVAKALQQHCDIPGWPKFEGNLYEIYGMDEEAPRPDDVSRICDAHRRDGDPFWPSNFLIVYRRELIAGKRQATADDEYGFSDPSRNAKLLERYAAGAGVLT